ncbi:hypothetical protein ACMGDM_16460 [Sphingomonas sp. DT-51]
MGVPLYNLFVVVHYTSIHESVRVLIAAAIAVLSATASIAAGASLRQCLSKTESLSKVVAIYVALFVLFICQAVALPAVKDLWFQSPILLVAAGLLIGVQATVTSYLKKIAWDRAVSILELQASAGSDPR